MNDNSHGTINAAINDNLTRARETQDYQAAQAELRAALEKLERLTGSDRFNMELVVWMQYAAIAEHADDLQVAVEYREKLTVRRPENPTSLLALSRLYRKLGNAEKEAQSLVKCTELAEQLDDKSVLAVLATKGYLPKDQVARARRLDDAVATYRAALTDRTFEASPDKYAVTQSNLGNLYRRQAELLAGDPRARKLEEAINAYREALKGHTPEAFPDQNRSLSENLAHVEKLLNDRS
jgi:tetratricopeptide (TPR) repeat protein